jgi:hypothetical protein
MNDFMIIVWTIFAVIVIMGQISVIRVLKKAIKDKNEKKNNVFTIHKYDPPR